MSVGKPRISDLPWFWRPRAIIGEIIVVTLAAVLLGLLGYWVNVRAAGFTDEAPRFAPVAALALGAGLFLLGVGIGLLGAPVFMRWWEENWQARLEHYHRYGRPWWKLSAAGFTREVRQSASPGSSPFERRGLTITATCALVIGDRSYAGE